MRTARSPRWPSGRPPDDSAAERTAHGNGWRPARRPWFGPKRFGFGYGPQTWQGVLVSVVLVLFVAGTAAVTGGHSPLMVVPVATAILVPLIIIRIQKR